MKIWIFLLIWVFSKESVLYENEDILLLKTPNNFRLIIKTSENGTGYRIVVNGENNAILYKENKTVFETYNALNTEIEKKDNGKKTDGIYEVQGRKLKKIDKKGVYFKIFKDQRGEKILILK